MTPLVDNVDGDRGDGKKWRGEGGSGVTRESDGTGASGVPWWRNFSFTGSNIKKGEKLVMGKLQEQKAEFLKNREITTMVNADHSSIKTDWSCNGS